MMSNRQLSLASLAMLELDDVAGLVFMSAMQLMLPLLTLLYPQLHESHIHLPLQQLLLMSQCRCK
jgi:hypothetical protein